MHISYRFAQSQVVFNDEDEIEFLLQVLKEAIDDRETSLERLNADLGAGCTTPYTREDMKIPLIEEWVETIEGMDE